MALSVARVRRDLPILTIPIKIKIQTALPMTAGMPERIIAVFSSIMVQ